MHHETTTAPFTFFYHVRELSLIYIRTKFPFKCMQHPRLHLVRLQIRESGQYQNNLMHRQFTSIPTNAGERERHDMKTPSAMSLGLISFSAARQRFTCRERIIFFIIIHAAPMGATKRIALLMQRDEMQYQSGWH